MSLNSKQANWKFYFWNDHNESHKLSSSMTVYFLHVGCVNWDREITSSLLKFLFLNVMGFLLLMNLHFKSLKCSKKQEVCVNKAEYPQYSGWLNYFLKEALQGNKWQSTQVEMKDRPLEAVAATAGTNRQNSITGSKSLTVFYLALNNSMKRKNIKLSVLAGYWPVLYFLINCAKFCWKILKPQKNLLNVQLCL